MNDLIRFFWDLCLLRRSPGDLPASLWLLQLVLLLNLVVNGSLGVAVFGALTPAILAALVELVLSAGLLFAALQVRGRAQRWQQAYTALLGAGVVLGVIALGYRGLLSLLGVGTAAAPDLMLFLWSLLVMAHVLRQTLEIALLPAIVIVIAYTMFLFGLIAQWFAPELVTQGP